MAMDWAVETAAADWAYSTAVVADWANTFGQEAVEGSCHSLTHSQSCSK